MKWLTDNWLKILQIVCVLCIIANCIVFLCYHTVFNGRISNDLNDWNLFVLMFNGIITVILTVVNINVAIRINSTIENSNDERHARGLIFEAQSILSKMRFDDYKRIQKLINDIKVSLYRHDIPIEQVELLKKELMGLDFSFLYKSQQFKQEPFLRPITEALVNRLLNVLSQIKVKKKIDESEIEKLQNDLSSFLNMMEFYIISQLVRDNVVQNYICEHENEMDCTISCIQELAKEVVDKMNNTKSE